jgi:hypothetical protein
MGARRDSTVIAYGLDGEEATKQSERNLVKRARVCRSAELRSDVLLSP